MFIKSSLMANKQEAFLTLLILRCYKLKPPLDITILSIAVKVKKTEKMKR